MGGRVCARPASPARAGDPGPVRGNPGWSSSGVPGQLLEGGLQHGGGCCDPGASRNPGKGVLGLQALAEAAGGGGIGRRKDQDRVPLLEDVPKATLGGPISEGQIWGPRCDPQSPSGAGAGGGAGEAQGSFPKFLESS